MKYKYLCFDGYVKGTADKPPQVFYKFKDETGKEIRQDFYSEIKKQFVSMNLGLVTEINAKKIGRYLSMNSPMDLSLDSKGKLTLPVIYNLYDIIHY